MSPPSAKVGGHVPPVSHQIAPMPATPYVTVSQVISWSTWNKFIAAIRAHIKFRMVFYSFSYYFWGQHCCWTCKCEENDYYMALLHWTQANILNSWYNCLIVFPLKILVLSSGVSYGGQCNRIYAVCDVNMTSFWRLALVWRSLLTQRAYYSTRTLLTRYCSLHCVTVIHIN